MKNSRFTEGEIAYALRQAESGTTVADVCRQVAVSETASSHRSRPSCATIYAMS